ncbi:UNVERIFIED_CONTAM: hypothetical protein Scaly_0509900 [Sesamum calycinum]|uniref:Uncharacterized protein n=1 Tax=Sesamum calycinum TaxID=2727403 RepID=A0AAW2RRZ7_9LAMI
MKTGTSLHAKRKRVIVELVKGKEIATRLQTLLRIPGQDHGSSSVSPGDLAFQILRSFNKTLSVLSSSCAATSPRIAAVDCGGSACSGESKQKPGVKSRRDGAVNHGRKMLINGGRWGCKRAELGSKFELELELELGESSKEELELELEQ